MTNETKGTKYYVRNPVSLGGLQEVVKVVGYNDAETKKQLKAPYTVGRGFVIVALPGSEEAVMRWEKCLCIEPYSSSKHHDAILVPPAETVLTETPPTPPTPAKPGIEQSKPISEYGDEEGQKYDSKKHNEQSRPIHGGRR